MAVSKLHDKAMAGLALALGPSAVPALAAENGTSFYVLGLRGPGAGLTPPPGFYIQNDFYVYSADLGVNKSIPLNGRIAVDLKAKAYVDFLTAIWVTPLEAFGGKLAITVTEPYGGPSLDVRGALTGPRGNTFGTDTKDSASFFGDPVVGSFIGWESGKLHWQIGTSANVPVGQYDTVGLANVSFHRWINDSYISATWLDPELGLDLSTSVGFTINGVNHQTDYHTGDEFHLDASISKYLSKDFSVGVMAAFYQQVTGDSGQGATLGPYRGRVTDVGATAAYTFHVGPIPISTRIKVLREFNPENRLQHGTAGFLTVSMPLWVPSAMAKSEEANPVTSR